MILLSAVVAGLTLGLIRASRSRRTYLAPKLKLEWLVVLAFLPQGMSFFFPRGSLITESVIPVILVVSQAGLLVFAWINRREPGFWALGIGLALNFIVIVVNGGLMPITPEMARWVHQYDSASGLIEGQRLGNGKDIILRSEAIRLWFLADIFPLNLFERYRVAFSAGDVLIALGAFWLLYSLGGPAHIEAKIERKKQ